MAEGTKYGRMDIDGRMTGRPTELGFGEANNQEAPFIPNHF